MGERTRVYAMVDFEGGACVVGAPGMTITEHKRQYEPARHVLAAAKDKWPRGTR